MTRSSRLLSLAVLLAGFVVPASAQTFVVQPQFSGNLTYGMHLADLDGDTDLDLVYMGLDGPNVVFKNNGAGVLTQHQAIPNTLAGVDAATADFDRDGDLDVVFANGFFNNENCGVRCDANTLFLNNGSGTFAAVADWTDGEAGGTQEIAVADFDGDGWMDFVTANWQFNGGTGSAVWLNNGTNPGTFAGFTRLELPSGPHSARAVAVGDFNGDATPDIVMSFGQLFLSNGPASWTYSSLGFTAVEVLAGNVDGVDRDDIVVPGNWAQHHVRLNNGSGSFAAQPAFGSSSPLFKGRLVDISGEGNLDLVVAADGGGTRVYVGDGSGGFTASTVSSHGGNRDVVAGDLNGDGRVDFASTFNSTFGGEVWLNSGRNVFTVTSPADSGPGTLRQAILNANATPNLPLIDRIEFVLTSSVIAPLSALPVITEPLFIDGLTQPGSTCGATPANRVLPIGLDGSAAGSGAGIQFALSGGEASVRGLLIYNFPGSGIEVSGATSGTIACNAVGTNAAMNAGLANGSGITLWNSSNVVVGGGAAGQGNVVSGNTSHGIASLGSGAGNALYGNYVGLAADGTTVLPNGVVAVALHDAGTIVGGPTAGQRNYIVGGSLFGIEISGSGHVILGNHIGADVNGNAPAGAGQARGINVGTASDVTIGGESAGEGNLIAYNSGRAIRMNDDPAATGNRVIGNEMRDNGSLGFDIGEDGLTANDPGDADTGGNNRQNFPDVTLAHIDGGDLTVNLTQNSTNGGGAGSSTYPITVHAYVADAAGFGGQRYLASAVIPAASAQAPVILNFGDAAALGVSLGTDLVLTATDAAGNTSEFSPVAPVVDPLVVTNTDDSGTGSLRSAILFANANPGTDTISFAIPGGGPHVIQILNSLPVITEAVLIDGYTQSGATPNTAAGFAPGNAVLMVRVECAVGCPGTTNAFFFTGHSGSTLRGVMTGSLTGAAVTFHSSSSGNTVAGNYFGTDGSAPLGNGSIQVSGSDNVVGGPNPADRNLIVGGGVSQSPSALKTIIRGNFFGTNAAGTARVGSGATAANIAIGSNQARETEVLDNLIANANWYAIESTMANCCFGDANWTIEGNRIGTDVSGTLNLGNSAGIFIQKGANGSVIRSNVIANNPGFGVRVSGGDGEYSPKFIAIRGNSFFDNGQNGIVFGTSTVNGPANEGIVAPTLVSAEVVGNGSLVLTVTADAGTIEFFEADGSGAEGRVQLGTPVIHLGGTAAYPVGNAAALDVLIGDRIVATRTDASHNTSMFSANATVVAGSTEIARYRANGNLDDALGNHPAEWGNSAQGINGTAAYAVGVDGSAFSFDGNGANGNTTASFVSVPTLGNVTLGGDSFTFAAWVNPTACPSGECQIASTSKHNVDFGWELRMNGGGSLDFTWVDSGLAQRYVSSSLPLGRWSHVAVSWDALTNLPSLYVDGVFVGSAGVPANPMLTDVSGKLVIGENNDWLVPSQTWGPFQGLIDEVRVFSAALDGADIAAIFAEFTPPADPLVVTNTADSGVGSLRGAIEHANATPGFDTISFAIPGAGPHVIAPATPLPLIEDPVEIDGLSQSGATCGPDVTGHDLQVVLRGDLGAAGASGNGVHIFGNGSGSIVQGLVIQGFPGSGVAVEWAERVSVRCNFIGTTADGSAPYDNGEWAVVLRFGTGSGADRNVIGGPSTSDANLLGSVRLGHVVSLNESAIVQNNRVGVSPSGASLLSTEPGVTTYTGVNVGDAASGSTISDNEIGGGFVYGIEFQGGNGVTVSGNRIGIGPGGEDWGNGIGIWLQKGSSDNILGPDNVIAYNGIGIAMGKGDGGLFPGTPLDAFPVRNRITDNSIFANDQAGIDLATGNYADGLRNTDDAGDADVGANDLQNAPVGLSVDRQATGPAVATFTVDTPLAGGATVELFKADASGTQGLTLLGTLVLPDMTNAASQVHAVEFDGSSLGLADRVVATITNAAGSTSEFSLPGTVEASFEVPAGFVYGTTVSNLTAPPTFVGIGRADYLGLPMSVIEGGQLLYRYAADGNSGSRSIVAFAADYSSATSALFWGGYDWVVGTTFTPGILQYSSSGGSIRHRMMEGGYTFIAVGPDGCMYQGISGTLRRMCLNGGPNATFDPNSGSNNTVATILSGGFETGGLAWDSAGNLYVSIPAEGKVVRVPAGGGGSISSFPAVATGLSSPRTIALSEDDQLFVATATGIVFGPVGAPLQPFAQVPNASIAMAPLSQLLVGDPASGKVHRFVIPVTQEADAPLRFYLTTELRDMMPGVEGAVTGAFAAWTGIPTADAAGRMEYGGISPYPAGEPSITDYRNEIHLGGLPLGPSTLAVASKLIKLGATPEDSRIVTADVVFNERFAPAGDAKDKFVIGVSTTDHDIQGILTHELGHAALGLIHSLDPTATMFFVLPKDARDLKVDDEAQASVLAPSGSGEGAFGTITGSVVSGNPTTAGMPVAAAGVLATNLATNESLHAYTDRNGDFSIRFVPPGQYRLGVFALDGSVFSLKWPLTPGRVSRHLQTIANELDFLEEYWNGTNESANDVRTEVTEVSVTAGAVSGGIDFVTNLDTVPPRVTSMIPANQEIEVFVKPVITVQFSEGVRAGSFAATLRCVSCGTPAEPLALTLDQDLGRLAVAMPTLAPLSIYEVSVNGATDRQGNVQTVAFTSRFTTRNADTTAPTVESVTPGSNDAPGISQPVIVTFSEPMDGSTLGTGNFEVRSGSVTGPVVPGRLYSTASTVLAFEPAMPWSQGTDYTIVLKPGLTDLGGNPVSTSDLTYSFSTPVDLAPTIAGYGPVGGTYSGETFVYVDFSEPVVLGTAGPFSLEGGSVPGTTELANGGTRVVFTPLTTLAAGSYGVSFDTTGIVDASGNPAPAPSPWSFQVAGEAEALLALSPHTAAVGSLVTLDVAGFIPVVGETVTFAGGATAPAIRVSGSSLAFEVPEGAQTGTVSLRSLSGPVFTLYVPDAYVEPAVRIATTDSGPRDVEASPDGTLAVAVNTGSNSVSVIDIATGASTSIPVEKSPLRVAITPDGTRAYVTNFESHSVSVIDLTTRTVVQTIPVGYNPYGIDIAPDGSLVYVAEYTSRSVSIIDAIPTSGTYNLAIRTIDTSSSTREAATDPDGGTTRLITEGGTREAADAPDGANAKLASESNPRDVEANPDGSGIWIGTNYGILAVEVDLDKDQADWAVKILVSESTIRENSLSPDGGITRLASEGTVRDASGDPEGGTTIAAKEGSVRDLETNPDGTFLFITTATGQLLVHAVPESPYDADSPYEAITKLGSESNTRESAVSPDGTLVYVTNYSTGTVSIYSFGAGLATSGSDYVSGASYGLVLLDVVKVGAQTEGIAYSAAGNFAVVANAGSSDVSFLTFEGTPPPPDGVVDEEEPPPPMPDADGDGVTDFEDPFPLDADDVNIDVDETSVSDRRELVPDRIEAALVEAGGSVPPVARAVGDAPVLNDHGDDDEACSTGATASDHGRGRGDRDDDDRDESCDFTDEIIEQLLRARQFAISTNETRNWDNALHPSSKHGHKVFDNDKKVAASLSKVIAMGGDDSGTVTGILDDVVEMDFEILEGLLGTRTSGGPWTGGELTCATARPSSKKKTCEKELADARKEFVKAYDELADGDVEKAIDRLKKAWEQAGKAAKIAGRAGELVELELAGLADDLADGLPTEYALDVNYPNPFNPETTIGFALPESGDVRLEVFDVLGRRVRLLAEGPMNAGWHRVTFRADDLPSGVYLYRIQAGTFTKVRQMVLVK